MVFKRKKKKIISQVDLNKQIAEQKRLIAKQKKRGAAEAKRLELETELKFLKRSASTKRNIILGKRIARGSKILGGKIGRKLSKQAKLIRDQQLRDAALERRDAKKFKKRKKTKRKSSSGRSPALRDFNPIGDLDF